MPLGAIITASVPKGSPDLCTLTICYLLNLQTWMLVINNTWGVLLLYIRTGFIAAGLWLQDVDCFFLFAKIHRLFWILIHMLVLLLRCSDPDLTYLCASCSRRGFYVVSSASLPLGQSRCIMSWLVLMITGVCFLG